ncbi:MAG: ABC transporter substrate-binding protein [Proteobacteria bacterium]|nr:ABC transporter substrate-binding protein [Pseudomonadota bacterium]
MVGKISKLLGLAVLISTLVLSAGPVAAEQFKGTLKVGHITDLTGPAAKTCRDVTAGIQGYVRYINEEKGGVDGYKLVVEDFDSKIDSNLLLSATKRYCDELDVKFIYTELASIFIPAIDIAQEKKVVMMCTSGHPKYTVLSKEDEKAGKENFHFIHTPTVVGRMALAIEWIKDDWKKKGKAGAPKIAGLNMDNEAGHMTSTASRVYAERAGFKWVGAVYLESSSKEAVSQVSTLKKWEADYVIGAVMTGAPLMVFIKDMYRMKYKPQVMHHGTLISQYLATLHPGFEDQMAYQYCIDWTDTDNAEVQLMHKLEKKWNNKEKYSPYYVVGWHAAMIFTEALRRAVEKFGPDKLTGPNIKWALESLNNFDVKGLSDPITYTTWDHQGNRSIRWVKFEKGKLVPVSGFKTAPELTDDERDSKYWLQKD